MKLIKIGMMVATVLFATSAMTSCGGDDKVPAAAGTISGPTELTDGSIQLSIGAIKNADTYKWYKNDTPVQENTSRTLTVTAPGEYRVAGVNKNGQGNKSPIHTVTVISGGKLNFTDIPAGTYAGNGTPDFLQTPGPTTWSGQMVPQDDEVGQYYAITAFGGTNITVFVNLIDGELFIENEYVLGTTADKTLNAIFQAAYMDSQYIYFLTEFSPIYNASTNTMDFSAKVQGDDGNTYDVFIGVGAFSATDGNFGGAFTDLYSGLQIVVTPTAGAPALVPMVKAESVMSAEKMSGLKFGGFVSAKNIVR